LFRIGVDRLMRNAGSESMHRIQDFLARELAKRNRFYSRRHLIFNPDESI
jgi:hypothetical protein